MLNRPTALQPLSIYHPPPGGGNLGSLTRHPPAFVHEVFRHEFIERLLHHHSANRPRRCGSSGPGTRPSGSLITFPPVSLNRRRLDAAARQSQADEQPPMYSPLYMLPKFNNQVKRPPKNTAVTWTTERSLHPTSDVFARALPWQSPAHGLRSAASRPYNTLHIAGKTAAQRQEDEAVHGDL
jgi:hypothetical protein